MLKNVLQELNKLEYPVYEHKLQSKFGVNQALLDDAVVNGWIVKTGRASSLPYERMKITDAGKVKLAELLTPPPPPRPPQPTAAQLRIAELKDKLKADTITNDELRELLKLVLT